MPVSVEQVLDALRNEEGRVIIPPHLAGREYDSLEEAASDGVSYMEELRKSAWACGEIIASQYLPAEDETRLKVARGVMTPQERVDTLAGLIKHFASQYGVDPETIRRWLKIACVFPEQVEGPKGPEDLRVFSVAINVYLAALEALRYGADKTGVISWARDAIDNDWTAHRLRQEIKAKLDPDESGPVLAVREWFNHELPGDMGREQVIALVTEALDLAYKAAGRFDNGPLANVSIKVLGRYEVQASPKPENEVETEPSAEAAA